jgi:hypothetical protein
MLSFGHREYIHQAQSEYLPATHTEHTENPSSPTLASTVCVKESSTHVLTCSRRCHLHFDPQILLGVLGSFSMSSGALGT